MVADDAGTLPAKYNLSDTQTDLGKNLSVAQEAAKAEQAQDIIDGALNASSLGQLAVTYSLLDSLANIYLADPSVVSGASSYSLTTTSVNLTPATTVAATAETLAALQDVIDGAATGKGPLAATYSLADTLANLSNPANADIVAGTTAWTLTDPAGSLGTLTEAQAAVVAGATNAADYTYNTAFTLTSEPDTVTLADNVQVFDAPKVYNPGGTDLINSLQNEDNLTGNTQDGAQATSLSADLGNPNDSGDFLINPIMNNIETLNIAFTNTADAPAGRTYLTGYASTGITLDLEDTAGSDTVKMTRITGDNRASIINMDGQEVTTVSVSNSNAQSQALFTFLNSTMGVGTTNTLAVNLNNVSLYDATATLAGNAALAISSTDPQGSEYQEGIEVFNITVGGSRTSTVATFDTGNSDYDDIIPGELPQTLNITANQGLDIGTFRWFSNRVENNNSTSANFLNDANHDVGVNGIGLIRTSQINNITLSGAGNVSLANVGNFESVLDVDTQVDFVLNASGLSGNLTADITNAASSTDTSTSITGGSGTNKLYAASTDVRTSVSAGAGSNDSLTVQSNAGQTVNLRAGTGIETLNLVAGIASAAPTWNADLSNGGFDLVTINNQAATAPMAVVVTDADVGNTSFSIRSQGLDGLDQPVVTGTQGAVTLNIAQAATAAGDTLSLHLGEVASDQSSTNAFSWKNFTNNVTLFDSSAAAVAIDNLDFQINSAGLVGASPAPVNLTLNVNDFVGTMTVTTGNGSTNVFNAGDLTYAAAANAIGAETYDGSAYNGDQNLIFGGTQGRQATLIGATSYPGQTVLTGTGDDFIDLSYITTNTARTAAGYLTSTFLLNSTVNSAAGTDSVVLSADLADPRTVLLADPNFDDWFTNWDGVENLIVNGRNVTSSYVAYDWDAQAAGLQNISFTATDNSTTGNTVAGRLNNATIYLGYNYTGNAVPFVINSNVNTLQTIDSRSLVDIQANINNPVVSEVRIVSTGATLVGASDNDFELNYNNISSGLTIVGGATLAGPVNLAVENGSLDEVNFDGDIDGANVVSVTTSDALTAIGETTEYDFRGLVNNLAASTGSIVFDASAESNTPGLTIFGSTDGGTIASGNVSNDITGTDGNFINGFGNDTIESGGFSDVITGLGGADTITYTNARTGLEAGNGVTISGGAGLDVIVATANSANASVSVDGGVDDDTITVSTAGNSTTRGGLGQDAIEINVQAASANLVEAGENADYVLLSGSSAGAVTVQQGLNDSNRAVTTDFGADDVITVGDTMTFSNGVDIVEGFDTDVDVLLGDIRISRSLLGQDATALVSSGWLSGEYDETTGRFTIAANGDGTDVAYIQFTDAGASDNGNITTSVANRNQNVLILRDVDSDDLANTNFANAAGTGVVGENVIPLSSVAGALTLENGSWTANRLYIDTATSTPVGGVAAQGYFYGDALYTTLAADVAPNPATGFAQAGLTSVDLSNLGGSNTGAATSAGVEIRLDGGVAASNLLTSVTTTNGNDNIVFADGADLGDGTVITTINGGGGTDTLTFTTQTLAQTLGSGAFKGGVAGMGNITGIENVVLTAGNSAALTLDASVTVAANGSAVAVQNASGAAAATVNLGAGAAHTYTSASTGVDTVTLGLTGQTATLTNGGINDVVAGSVAGATVTTDATVLTINATGTVEAAQLAGNYTNNGGAASSLVLTAGNTTATVTTGTITGFETLDAGKVGAATAITLGAASTGLTTLTGDTTTADLTYNVSLTQLGALTTVSSAAAGSTLTLATTATPGGSVNLATSGLTMTELDVLTFDASTSAVTVTATAAQVAAPTLVTSNGFIGSKAATDVLNVTTALTAAQLDSVTGFETINLAGAANAVTTLAGLVAAGTTATIDASAITGKFTLNALTEVDGTLNVIGSDLGDSLTLANINLAAGVATVTAGSANDIVTLGSAKVLQGALSIDLAAGGDDVVEYVSLIDSTGPSASVVDDITGFTVGATAALGDAYAITIGDVDVSGGAALEFASLTSAGASADIAAAIARGASTVSSIAANAGAVTLTASTELIKLTSVTGTSFADAIGTTVVDIGTVALTDAALISWFDDVNDQAVVSYYVGTGAPANLDNTSATLEIARIDMSAADYANFGANQVYWF